MSTVQKSIRLYAWRQNYHVFDIVQDEVLSRHFNIQLMETTTPVNLTDCRVYFHADKPDSNTVYVECEVLDRADGQIKVTLSHQMAACDGLVNCFIQVVSQNKTDLRFDGLKLNVKECNLDDSVESSSEFPALVKALSEIVPATERADAATARANQSAANADIATANANQATSAAYAAKKAADDATADANNAAEKTRQATDKANTATENANAATAAANTATKNANTAASSASSAASDANAAASRAGNAADIANEATVQANKATAAANTAAGDANAAALSVSTATAAATTATAAANKAKDDLYQAKENGEFDGYTPVRGLDYFTQGDQDSMISEIILRMGGNPIFGVVYPDNSIVVQGIIADGTYSLSYQMEDGRIVPVGNFEVESDYFHAIESNTTFCTNSNSDTSIVHGGYYTASIIADAGYVVSSVKVTMGGVDITSTAVKGSTITIENVTGALKITASAVLDTSKPRGNVANPSSPDWITDGRFSSTAENYYKECTGCIVTNYISAKPGDVIRVKGLKINGATNSEYARVATFDINKKYINYLVTGAKSTVSGEGALEQVSVDGDIMTYTILMHGDGTQRAKDTMEYVRISAGLLSGYTANDVIITINEAIDGSTTPGEGGGNGGGTTEPEVPDTPETPNTGNDNLADPTSSDWVEGKRMSMSTGELKDCDQHVVTNFIPAKMGDILRVKGMTINAIVNSKECCVIAFKADKTKQAGVYTGQTSSTDPTGYGKKKVSVSGNVSTYTILMSEADTNKATAETAFIRIDGSLMSGFTSNDVVITINKEIT